jgi:hypothetical protein
MKNISLCRRFPEYSDRFRSCSSTVGRGIDEPFRDSHDGPEGDAWERIVPVAKSYTRVQWDEFVHALEALPEKPRNEQRVTVSDAMKEIRAHITATQAKGYTLEEIVQQAGRNGLDVSIGAVKYALYRPASSDAVSKTANPQGTREADQSSRPKQAVKRKGARVCDARDDTRQQRGRGVSQPGSMEIQDTFSFEIRPDIENL